MPLYRFKCSVCGHEFTELVSYNERDNVVCPKCGGKVQVMPGNFISKMVYITGATVVRAPGLSKPHYTMKETDWTPPKEYLKAKGLDKLNVY